MSDRTRCEAEDRSMGPGVYAKVLPRGGAWREVVDLGATSVEPVGHTTVVANDAPEPARKRPSSPPSIDELLDGLLR